MRNRTGLLLALIALAIAPAAARAAAPVSIPVPRSFDALDYAAGRVLWATHSGHGPIVVTQAPAAGGARSVLATIPRVHPSSADVTITLHANAMGFVVTARDGRLISTGECGCDYDVSQGELVVRGGYDGTLHTVVSCRPPRGASEEQPPDLQTAAGTHGFALGGAQCGTPAPIDTIAADGTVTPVPGLTPSTFYGLSYAEPYLAVDGDAKGSPRTAGLHVFDLAHATRRDLATPNQVSGSEFDVQADGTLVLGPGSYANSPPSIYTWAPGAAAPQAVPGVKLEPLGGFVAAAGHLLFAQTGPVGGQFGLPLIGLDGTGLRALGAPGVGRDREPLDFDGTTAAFLSKTCTGAPRVTLVDVTDTTPAAGPLGCPVQVLSKTVSFSRSGRGSISILCPNGCGSDFQLWIDLHDHRISTHEVNRYVDQELDSRIANGKLRLAASPTAQRVPVRLVKPARRLLRRHPRFRVFTDVGYSSDIGVGPEIIMPNRQTAKLRGH